MDVFWTIVAVLIVLWLFGFLGGIGGSLIHLLILVAVVVIIYRLIIGKKIV